MKKDLKLASLLGAVDRATKPLQSLNKRGSAEDHMNALRSSQNELRRIAKAQRSLH